MKYHQEKKFTDSWFFKWFLNNQAVVAVLITFLVFLTLLSFYQDFIFIYADYIFYSYYYVAFGDFGNSLLLNQTLG